jgi:hypothetical protein
MNWLERCSGFASAQAERSPISYWMDPGNNDFQPRLDAESPALPLLELLLSGQLEAICDRFVAALSLQAVLSLEACTVPDVACVVMDLPVLAIGPLPPPVMLELPEDDAS